MNKNSQPQSGIFNPRALAAVALCAGGVFLTMLSLAVEPPAKQSTAVNSTANGPVGNWEIVPAPSATDTMQKNYPSGITCVSTSECWAVGIDKAYNGAPLQTVIQHWDGTSWAVVDSPNTAATRDNVLRDVACTSQSNCWAVGYFADDAGVYRTLIERWNGSSWNIFPSANTADGRANLLIGVTCSSASDCWAVGQVGDQLATLTEHWDGSSWRVVDSPNVDPTYFHSLWGVACTSASDCWAAGFYKRPVRVNGTLVTSIDQTLVERWDGTSWTIVPSPNLSSVGNNHLFGIACASATECWGVGNGVSDSAPDMVQTLIERWDGTSWSIVTSPNGSASSLNLLYGVSCAAASNCWAVGHYANEDGTTSTYYSLAAHWDGISWSLVPTPNVQGSKVNFTLDVACPSATECWTIGEHWAGTIDQTTIEHWNGSSWTITPSDNGKLPPYDVLSSPQAATCISDSDCWAVGFYKPRSGGLKSLTEHWDGNSWTVVPSPNVDWQQILYGVTCVSSSDCWAVGYYGNVDRTIYQTLIEHWDGASWTISPSPTNDSAQGNFLRDVQCTSATDCWAVGYSSLINAVPDASAVTLIERWNGTAWSLVSSPNNPGTNNSLYGLTCVSGSQCWAVGKYQTGVAFQTLIEQWNGSSWSIVSSPNADPTKSNVLSEVACSSASNCWAVGYYTNNSTSQTLIERWDGTSWTITPSANPATFNNLRGVACASDSECWTVGALYNGSVNYTLIERWDGSSWTIITSPNIDATSNSLYSVVCPSSVGCWAVGEYFGYDFTHGVTSYPLMEHYTLPVVQLNAVVSRKTHGSAGSFDINLPLTGNPGIECRSGGTNGDYTLLFTFANTLTNVTSAGVTNGTGSVATGNIDSNDAHNFIVNLIGVSNAQAITVSLSNVTDSAGNFSSAISAQMGVLIGDVNASGVVTSGDTNLCKAQALQPVTNANFRNDINASGSITTGDVNIIKQNALTQLPP